MFTIGQRTVTKLSNGRREVNIFNDYDISSAEHRNAVLDTLELLDHRRNFYLQTVEIVASGNNNHAGRDC